jgi:predicted transposase/invertase (TIGR01784 family)
MAGANRVDQVMHVVMAFRIQEDLAGFRKYFAFWVVEGRLSVIEQREVKQRLKEMDMPEIMEWFKQEGLEEGIAAGIQAKALEDARKLVEHGVSWEIITSATGIKPEDLEAK